MCGIVGIIKYKEQIETERIKRMLNLISHRGPDNYNIFENGKVHLGHCRLSIIDFSQKANQPMNYKDEIIITYNGEIYNFQELRKILEKKGYKFKSRCDTEVLLLGYSCWGEKVIDKIKGFFSFAIWDKKKQIIFCARDPFGKKPFYYHSNKNGVTFASGINSLIEGIGFKPKIDYKQISSYLLKGYFEAGFSIYENIHTLKAGHFLRIDIEKKYLKTGSYCTPKFNLKNNDNINYEEACKKSEELIKKAIKKRLISDAPLGTLLSGGVDSSLITLMANEISLKPINAFTIAFREKKFDESVYAKKLVEGSNIRHKINYASDVNLFSVLSKMVQIYEEPFGDYSCMPTYQVFGSVKKHLRVVLTGDGGDEVFGGYIGANVYLLRKLAQPFFKYFSFLFYKWPEILLSSKYRLLRQISYAGIAMRFDGADLFYSLFHASWTAKQRKYFMRKEGWTKTGKNEIEKKMRLKYKKSGKTDMEKYLNLNLERLTELFLTKIDRASMANSVEARCPMLDIDLFDFVSKLPEKILFHNKIRKSIPKDILTKNTNKKFAYRRKMGFTPPLSCWLRDKKNIKQIEKTLLRPNGIIYELFEPNKIKLILKKHKSGHDCAGKIWKLLFLDEWHKQNFS